MSTRLITITTTIRRDHEMVTSHQNRIKIWRAAGPTTFSN